MAVDVREGSDRGPGIGGDAALAEGDDWGEAFGEFQIGARQLV